MVTAKLAAIAEAINNRFVTFSIITPWLSSSIGGHLQCFWLGNARQYSCLAVNLSQQQILHQRFLHIFDSGVGRSCTA
jgi:hypothetical protein